MQMWDSSCQGGPWEGALLPREGSGSGADCPSGFLQFQPWPSLPTGGFPEHPLWWLAVGQVFTDPQAPESKSQKGPLESLQIGGEMKALVAGAGSGRAVVEGWASGRSREAAFLSTS